VPKPITSNSTPRPLRQARLPVRREARSYRCGGPVRHPAVHSIENGHGDPQVLVIGMPEVLESQPLHHQCLSALGRWEHRKVVERMQWRLDRMPEAGRLRRQTVEHAFGTFKSWMGGITRAKR